ncbi:phosphohydrolase [Leptolyngbya sp. BL0902]|uniref:HD domain-containing protein n=1 Tax=Leptolyngbya sp. BL0902 TaxID=1115757 RepID=UPI0018E754BE|nr:HD domain-containing protein [Leptolyngbya sp. BL0902]QQE65380.1 phosphohydrolase [Leptolyngbya sp. BL0902]
MSTDSTTALVLQALQFAALKHRDQRRKDEAQSPYVNHLITVANLLANVGGVTDPVTLMGGVLHDTLEDTATTPAELEAAFGLAVCQVVQEVTDDKSLPKAERKRLQIEHAPHRSHHARQIKLADKISNVQDIAVSPPATWPLERRQEYLAWTEQVVAGCRGVNPALEALYDQTLAQGWQALGRS